MREFFYFSGCIWGENVVFSEEKHFKPVSTAPPWAHLDPPVVAQI
jgi:hypothetical protein